MNKLPKVHFITDCNIQHNFTHLDLVELALEGGAELIQFREKQYNSLIHNSHLLQIIEKCKLSNTLCVINDNIHLAKKVQAHGIHFGKEDANLELIHSEINTFKIVGYTVHNFDDLYLANKHQLSYIGVGPVFGTNSKFMKIPRLGLDGLSKICEASKHPVIAIGGINEENINLVMERGAYGVAVLSAFCNSQHPSIATERILTIMDRYN